VRTQFGEFTLDPVSRQLFRGHDVVHLSPKAFDVLRLLIEQRPRAISKTELHELVWRGTFVADASLTMIITEIRRVLGDEPHQPRYVRTVHRFGYAFAADAVDVDGEERVSSRSALTGHPAWLVWNGRALVLHDGENVVGRDPGCDVWLDAVGVSRRHARIIVSRGAATLEDLQSKNGTALDRAPIRTVVPLTNGVRIEFGPVDTEFRLWSDSSSTKTVKVGRKTT
jgi:DNA-binding winged helix-turn-helix (wHTH) protein